MVLNWIRKGYGVLSRVKAGTVFLIIKAVLSEFDLDYRINIGGLESGEPDILIIILLFRGQIILTKRVEL